MPVQNSNSKVSAHTDFATYLLQTSYQLYMMAYCVNKGNLDLSYVGLLVCQENICSLLYKSKI